MHATLMSKRDMILVVSDLYLIDFYKIYVEF